LGLARELTIAEPAAPLGRVHDNRVPARAEGEAERWQKRAVAAKHLGTLLDCPAHE